MLRDRSGSGSTPGGSSRWPVRTVGVPMRQRRTDHQVAVYTFANGVRATLTVIALAVTSDGC